MIETMEITLDQDIVAFIALSLEMEHPESYIIAAMHKIQERYGYLSEKHMDEVAHMLNIPTAQVFGIATFYHFFRLKPRGKYRISICLGTACYVKGADRVLEAFKNELGIDLGETTADMMFSLEPARCLGVCALAPVVTINERVYSNVKPTQVSAILDKIKAEEVMQV